MYSAAATGQESWRNIQPPIIHPPEGQCSEPSSEPLSGQTKPSVIEDGDAELSPAHVQKYQTSQMKTAAAAE